MFKKLGELQKKFTDKINNLQFPRPETIDFPKCENKHSINFSRKGQANIILAQQGNSIGSCICLLKSGNILVGTEYIDVKNLTIKSYLKIYSIPDLDIVQEFNFPYEKDIGLYTISTALQLKNGNIFVIRDKLYEFEGENINEGPKRISNKIKEGHLNIKPIIFPDPIIPKKRITKEIVTYFCENMMEAVEGKLLFTSGQNHLVYYLDSLNLDPNEKILLKEEGNLDILFQSELYSDNLYICKNQRDVYVRCAELLVYDIKDFCNEIKEKKSPIFSIKVSNSENICGYCEYNKKYLILDTLIKGIYVINMETKLKVAVCDVTREVEPKLDNENIYGKMVKLDDGQVVRTYYYPSLIDIRECEENRSEKAIQISKKFVSIGKFIASLNYNGYLFVLQLYD